MTSLDNPTLNLSDIKGERITVSVWNTAVLPSKPSHKIVGKVTDVFEANLTYPILRVDSGRGQIWDFDLNASGLHSQKVGEKHPRFVSYGGSKIT